MGLQRVGYDWLTCLRQRQQSKNKEMGLYQAKKHFHSKRNYQQNEKAAYFKWDKTLPNYIYNELMQKICKELIQLSIKKSKQPDLKIARRPEQTFFLRRHTDEKNK